MIAELDRLAREREAAELRDVARRKRNGRLTRWSFRLFIAWPLLAATLWLFWRIGYESGLIAGCLPSH